MCGPFSGQLTFSWKWLVLGVKRLLKLKKSLLKRIVIVPEVRGEKEFSSAGAQDNGRTFWESTLHTFEHLRVAEKLNHEIGFGTSGKLGVPSFVTEFA